MFLCFCHLCDTHGRCRWNFIDKTLLRSFTSYGILYPSDPFPPQVRALRGCTPRHAHKLPPAGPVPGSQAHGAGSLQRAAIWEAEQSLWLYLPEWPQLPQALPVWLRQYTLYKPGDGISMRSAEVCFSKSGIWLQDWLREWPSSWLYLWFLLISLRLCWRPPWACRIHLTFRLHHSSKDGPMCVWCSPGPLNLVWVPVLLWTEWIFIPWPTLIH